MLKIVGRTYPPHGKTTLPFFSRGNFRLSYSPIAAVHVSLSTANLLCFAGHSLH